MTKQKTSKQNINTNFNLFLATIRSQLNGLEKTERESHISELKKITDQFLTFKIRKEYDY